MCTCTFIRLFNIDLKLTKIPALVHLTYIFLPKCLQRKHDRKVLFRKQLETKTRLHTTKNAPKLNKIKLYNIKNKAQLLKKKENGCSKAKITV